MSGELAAKFITEQLYQKTPEQLTEAQKQTVSALSQIASGLAGVAVGDSTASGIVSAEIGKRAVENNFLSEQEISILEKLSQKRALTQQDVELISRIKFKDKYSDELLARYQSDSNSLTDYEYGQLRMWVNEWLNYNSVEVNRVSKPITEMSLKYYNPELEHKYKQAKTIYSSFDYQLASSTLDGLALSSGGINIGLKSLPVINKVILNPTAQHISLGLATNGALQLASGQDFNWYEFGGAGIAAGVTHGMSLRNSIRTNMGISMGVSLVSGGNPLQDTTLSGVSTIISSQIKQPIISAISSELIQKAPQIGNHILPSTNLNRGGNDEGSK